MYRFMTLTMVLALAMVRQLAFAEPAELAVNYSDLDLSRTEGAKVLYQRLVHAARITCSPDKVSLENQERYYECIHSAVAAAVAKVDRPALTAYYQAKTPHGAPIQVAAK
jgi:UrcA family protein